MRRSRARSLALTARAWWDAPNASARLAGQLAAAYDLAARSDASLFAATDLTRYEKKVFSQNGEDGVVVEILNRIGSTNRFFVEFGAQGGAEANCVFAADVLGWDGLFIEADDASFDQLERKYRASNVVRTRRTLVTPENVERIFSEERVPTEPDLMSIDIDGNDYWVWRAISQTHPRIVVIEYNSSLESDSNLVQRYSRAPWNGTSGFGSALGALESLAADKGYRLVHTDLAGVNAFFVRSELADAVGVTRVPRRAVNFGLVGGAHPPGEPPAGWSTGNLGGD